MTPASGVAARRHTTATHDTAPTRSHPPVNNEPVDTSILDQYEIHPAADAFPIIEDTHLRALADDIRTHGQQEPIWTYRGQILDGRNRLLAATHAGVTPTFQEWKPTNPGDTPSTFVMSRNIHRRNLSKSQRAALAIRLEAMIAEDNKRMREQAKAQPGTTEQPLFSHTETTPKIALAKTPGTTVEFTGGSRPKRTTAAAPPDPSPEAAAPTTGRVTTGRARDQAAQIMEVSSGYLTDAKGIERESPEVFRRVLAGELTIPAAQDLLVNQAQAAGRLQEMKLRPGAVRDSLNRLGARAVPKKEAPPPIRLPKAGPVESSRTAVTMTVTFGNRTVAEEWLNRLQDDKRVLDLDYQMLDKPPAKKRTRKSR